MTVLLNVIPVFSTKDMTLSLQGSVATWISNISDGSLSNILGLFGGKQDLTSEDTK